MRRSFSCLHIRPPLPTFDSQPPDLGFVRPSGAILPSIGIGIPSRCSHPRGFSIVSPGQRKKNHHSHPDVFFLCVCVCMFLFMFSPVSHHVSLLSPGTVRRSPENFKHARDKDIKTIRRKKNMKSFFSASLVPSALICNMLWASCQRLLAGIKALPLSCRDIILYEHLAASTTNHFCPLALIRLSSPTGIHIMHPSSSSSSSFCSSSLSHRDT